MSTIQVYTDLSKGLLSVARPQVRSALGRVKPELLYPPFLEKLLVALTILDDASQNFLVTQGLRTWEEQHNIYMQGRRGIKGESKVTTVDAGGSAHNYGIAADAAYDLDSDAAGLQPSWDKPYMKIWADAGCEAGLDAGYYWKNFFDGPHVQLNIRKYGLSAGKQLKAVYQKGGMYAVYQFLDRYDWS